MAAFDPSMLGSIGNQPQVRSLLQMLGWRDPNAGGGGGAAPIGSGAGSAGGGAAPVGGGGGGDGAGGGGSPQPSSNPPENQQVLEYIRGLQGGDGLSSMANPYLRAASQPGMSGYFQYDPNQGGIVPQMQAATRDDLSNPLDYTSEQYQPRDTGGWFGLGPQRSDFPSPSTNNWQLLGKGPGWIMRNGQLINAMTPQAKQGLPARSDPSFSSSGENSVANYPRRVSPGGALTGRNVFDAYYWPGGDIMGYTRWPYQGDV